MRSCITPFVVLLAVIGCGEASRLPVCYPVSGRITQAGKPLAEAMVVLHPRDAAPAGVQKPLGYTGPDGSFKLTTYSPADGAPAGSYAVTVELRAPRQAGEEVIRDGRNLLPVRYGKADTSPLEVDVKAEPNELEPIDLPAR